MKKILSKQILCTISVFAMFFGLCATADAAYCNSPCPNPCAPSRTICEGSNCTTYCDSTTSASYANVHYSTPSLSFSYSTPGVSFSISNEIYRSNYYRHPNIVISSGFRPIYHKAPPKPPQTIGHKPSKPAQNHKPASKPPKKH